MFSVARNPSAPSGTSISPVAQLLKGNRPARRPNARFLASRSVNRIRIILSVYRCLGPMAIIVSDAHRMRSKVPGGGRVYHGSEFCLTAENGSARISPQQHAMNRIPEGRNVGTSSSIANFRLQFTTCSFSPRQTHLEEFGIFPLETITGDMFAGGRACPFESMITAFGSALRSL
jgi:hypothetical protein